MVDYVDVDDDHVDVDVRVYVVVDDVHEDVLVAVYVNVGLAAKFQVA